MKHHPWSELGRTRSKPGRSKSQLPAPTSSGLLVSSRPPQGRTDNGPAGKGSIRFADSQPVPQSLTEEWGQTETVRGSLFSSHEVHGRRGRIQQAQECSVKSKLEFALRRCVETHGNARAPELGLVPSNSGLNSPTPATGNQEKVDVQAHHSQSQHFLSFFPFPGPGGQTVRN